MQFLFQVLIRIYLMSIIKVTLINAVLARDTGIFTKMRDPYCILKLGQEEKRSGTRSNAGKNVYWGQVFRLKSQENGLKVQVFNENTFADDLLGEGDLNLSRFRAQPFEEQIVVELYFKGEPVGRVQMEIMGEGQIQSNIRGGQSQVNISNSQLQKNGAIDAFYNFMANGDHVQGQKKKEPQIQPQEVRRIKRVNSQTIEEGISNALNPNQQNSGWGSFNPGIAMNKSNTAPQASNNVNPFQVLLQNSNNSQHNGQQNQGYRMFSPNNNNPFGGPAYNYGNRPYNGWG